MLGHVLGSILGLIFAIFGPFALGAYLATSRAGLLGLVAMDITVLGSALFLPGMGVSAFSAPEEGQAYLRQAYRRVQILSRFLIGATNL